MPAFRQELTRLWLNGVLCDVTLVVAGRRYPCHRLILAASCPYFMGMFRCFLLSLLNIISLTTIMRHSTRFGESNMPEINISLDSLPDSILAFERVLLFLYTGVLEVSHRLINKGTRSRDPLLFFKDRSQ